MTMAVWPGRGQTRIDMRTQTKGVDFDGHIRETSSPHTATGISSSAKQGDGAKFQMFGGGTSEEYGIAVYDAARNLVAAGCRINGGKLACGDGTRMSTVALAELPGNGNEAFVIHGAPDQAANGCIVLSGQPSAGQVSRASGAAFTDEDGRTCAVMEWTNEAGIASLDQIPARRYGDLQDIPAAFAPAAHAAAHQSGGTDEIAGETPAAGAIPKAGAGGVLASGWLPSPTPTAKGGVQAQNCAPTGQFVQSINSDSSITCGTPPAGGSGAPATFFQNQVLDRNGATILTQANQARALGFYLPYPVLASRIMFAVSAADTLGCTGGANCYDFGIYDTAGNLKAHTGAMSLTSAGFQDVAFTGGTVLMDAGHYLLVFSGSATAARLSQAGVDNWMQGWELGFSSQSSSGVLLPTLAVRAASWSLGKAGYFGLR